MFTTLIHSIIRKHLYIRSIYVSKSHNTDYGTLLKCRPHSTVRSHKRYVAATVHSYHELLQIKAYLNCVICCHSDNLSTTTRPNRYLSVSNKKLSYRRETARQLPTWREGGAKPSSPLWLHLCVIWLNPKVTTYVRYVKRAVQ